MNSGKSGITRRSLLASIGGIVGLTALSHAVSKKQETSAANRSRQKLSGLRKKFDRLLPLWQEERKKYELSSNPFDYWKGPHGKAIIALGPAIIPYLIRHVKSGDFWFNVPLTLLTNVDISNGAYVSEQENSKLWVEWWGAGEK